jgi:hypothetical protein
MGLLFTVLVGLTSSICDESRNHCKALDVAKQQERPQVDPSCKATPHEHSNAAKGRKSAPQVAQPARKNGTPRANQKTRSRCHSGRLSQNAKSVATPRQGAAKRDQRSAPKNAKARRSPSKTRAKGWVPEPIAPHTFLTVPSGGRPF